MLSRASLLAIRAYQRFLSPRKGYGCAYRLANGGSGCSGFAKEIIADVGLIRAIPKIRERFADCKVAARKMSRRKKKHGDTSAPSEKEDRCTRYDPSAGCDCSTCCHLAF